MVFRRRDPRPILTVLTEFFFPRGGWSRAAQYVVHRLRRLPDPPHRIARGVFAGVFISFTPLFGFHFIGAWLIAWAIRGNILAALLATFFGNPLTTPVIAITSVELGHWILGGEAGVGLADVTDFFAGATTEIWRNFYAIFTSDVAEWGRLSEFFDGIFLPYLVGGIGPGLVFGVICYHLSLPIIGAYQRLRDRKRRERIEKAIAARQRAAEKARAEGAEAE
jgi:hypothetical protein